MEFFDWQKLASKLFCIIIFVAAAWVIPMVAFRILMPFLLAALICAALFPTARKLSRVIGISERSCRVILLAVSFFVISVILFEAVRKLYYELSEILRRIGGDETDAFLPDIFESRLGELVLNVSSSLLSALASALGNALRSIVSSAPSAILFAVGFVTSAIYFCIDGDRLIERIFAIIPESARKYFIRAREGITRTVVGCIKAYTVLFAITFALSFIGLLILGRKYALTTAFCIALVDMLPVLGTGAVLLPWAIFLCLTGGIGVGVGLAVLWLIITAVKSAVEPHIIGESIGISPILSLVAAYAGFKAFGVLGMIIAPVVAAIVREIWSEQAKQANQ